MKIQDNKKYFLAGIVVSIIVIVYFSLKSLTDITSVGDKVLMSEKEIKTSMSEASSQNRNYDYLSLHSIKGNKKYVSFSFKDIRNNGPESTSYTIYDVKNNTPMGIIRYKDISLNISNAVIIEHVDENTFIIIDSTGKMYSLKTSGEKIKIKFIKETNVTQNNFFKSIYKNNSLYIITRANVSKYNEIAYDNNILYELSFNKNFTEASVGEYKFNEEDFLYSFVVDREGNIGVVGGNSIQVPSDKIDKNKLPSDEAHIASLPTQKGNYKVIDSQKIWARFIHNEKLIDLSEFLVEKDLNNLYRNMAISTDLKLYVPKNVPLVLDDKYSVYTESKYESHLYNLPVMTVDKLKVSYIDKEEDNLEENKLELLSRSELLGYDFKNYIGFVSTNEGLVGIKEEGEFEIVNKSPLSYIHKDYVIYVKDNTLYYKK